jgi:hypothetical protein
MTADLITRNLSDQTQNFGTESIVTNSAGARQFFDSNTGEALSRALNAAAWDIQSSPLDNSFQLDPAQYAQASNLFQTNGASTALSNTYGAVASITSKLSGKSPQQLFQNGVMSTDLVDNVNFFRTPASQIGFNGGPAEPPYNNNLMLNAKILAQTT